MRPAQQEILGHNVESPTEKMFQERLSVIKGTDKRLETFALRRDPRNQDNPYNHNH